MVYCSSNLYGNTMKKITLGKEKKLMGVCSGIAEYTHLDVTLVRLLMLAFVFMTGFFPGVLFYIIAGVIMPEPEKQGNPEQDNG